jgi:hypothetical protein
LRKLVALLGLLLPPMAFAAPTVLSKWGDLHGSVARPDTAEIATLLALGDGFGFTD